MLKDYRNTNYCPNYEKLGEKKRVVVEMVKKDHPRARDIHSYISKNDGKYKLPFCQAYNLKCAYCGVSFAILPKEMFEIDHFIYEKSSRFGGSKANAGYIENLLLACHSCNHKKSSFEIKEDDVPFLHPDGNAIVHTFYRDEKYYIRISDDFKNNKTVSDFYEQVRLGKELNRLDYLLMNMIGMLETLSDDSPMYINLSRSVELLRRKRNIS